MVIKQMAVTRMLPVLAIVLSPATGLVGSQAFAGDLMAGKAKAEVACQVCHGLDGKAVDPMVAHLSGQQKMYLIAQLDAYRSGKRHHEQMNIIAKMLSDDDIENLAEWYSSIKITIEMPE
jgi:cytochrome c553